jgi:hydroxyethylthiazole kinase-like uncharacterized protein yjeF
LAIARLLKLKNYKVSVFVLQSDKKGTADFETNLERAAQADLFIHDIKNEKDFPVIDKTTIIIEALFGTGLNKPLTGIAADVVKHINKASKYKTVSIDLPGGLFSDASSEGNPVIQAHYTLTLGAYKTALLIQESGPYSGSVQVLDIGLAAPFLQTVSVYRQAADPTFIHQLYRPRLPFAHKGTYGHALLMGGSYGKMGAAVLAARACLHTGPGLLSCYIPGCGYHIMQTALPEAMVITDSEDKMLTTLPENLEKYKVVGIGPGLGTDKATQQLVASLIKQSKTGLVIDADGLNCLSLQPELLYNLPAGSVLTPHPKEFDRLFGSHADDFERLTKAEQKAAELNIIIVLKSHHTLIATPAGRSYFNNTGNAGMAKGGSGDILTGMITGLLAQSYPSEEAAIFGVYLHGLAGDLAAEELSKEAMTPSDIIGHLGKAFLMISSTV